VAQEGEVHGRRGSAGAAAPSLVVSAVDSNGGAVKQRRRVERKTAMQFSQIASRE
jgi:hypothetical protein